MLNEGARHLIAEALANKQSTAKIVSFQDDSATKITMGIRLTSEEWQTIKKRADIEGFTSANRWVVSMIRANLQREPEFGESGLDALYESNRLLAPIARNLDQLTRDVRQNGIQVAVYRFQIMESLHKSISAHIRVIAKVVSRNVGRWITE